jgi:aspartyl-tRNA(Asn)/glutamyl-tRNA(Gln) amidotransferase subunit C
MLSKQEVQHVSKLARIALSSKEEEKFQKELSSILDFVEKLKEVDIAGAELTFHSIPLKNIMREDRVEPKTKEEVKKIIKLMPKTENSYLKVKSVFE